MGSNATNNFKNSITAAARIAILFAIALMFAMPLCPRLLAGDDHNPIGVTGAFEGVITTGCAYNVLNHNARREIDDIVVPGAIGKYGLKMTRYYNSRSTVFGGSMGSGWTHGYQWEYFNGVFSYPNGDKLDASCESPLGVSDGWEPGNTGDFRLADGGKLHFDNSNGYFQVRTITDPYGQTTTLAYNSSGFLSRVTEPGGRYLQLTYTGQNLLSEVDAYDGRGQRIDSVVYHYTSVRTGGNIVPTAMCLTSVDYSDGTHASYTYTTDNQSEHPRPPCPCTIKLLPLLQTCQDVRYKGAMRHICYEYPAAATHGALTAEKYSLNGSTNGPRISRTDPGAPSPLGTDSDFSAAYTETRGDGPTRTFAYTRLHMHRFPDDSCPTVTLGPPQQFLLSYTDFQNHTTQVGYDANWYVNAVRDANGHTTSYTRGPLPDAYQGPRGTGQILRITHPDNTSINYTYYDETPNISGHYLQQITDERGNITYHYRDANHRIYQTNYPDGGYETFTYNGFGQVLTHQLKNGAYERFAYDTRGLLTDKWNPRQGAVSADGDPHTHYTYYTSGPWTDRVLTMTLPPNASGTVASESYEYDRNTSGTAVAGRGLVTKITHADGTYQAFGYDAYGNKVWAQNELRLTTTFAYDNYNRLLSTTNPLGQTTSYTYMSGYLQTTNNPATVTTPTGILTTNGYDQNWRKISATVASSTTRFGYDNVGNPTTVTDPLNHTTTTAYDNRNRKRTVTDALSQTTTFTYDAASNVTRIDHPDATWEIKTYDAVNRMLTDTVPQTSAINLITQFVYNPSGTISRIINPRGQSTWFTYNASDEKITMLYQGQTQSQSWVYDAAHNLASRTTVGGKVQTFGYDNRNRKITMRWNNNADWADFGYDDAGRLSVAANASSTASRAYDAVGRLYFEQQNITGFGIKDVRYEHDADGNQTRLYVVNTTYDYRFSYDSMGRFEKISWVGLPNPVWQYTYDLASNETARLNLYDGVSQTYTPRDALNRMTRRDIKHGATTISYEAYTYDAMNRLRSVAREDGKSDSFTYYLDGELNTAQYGATTPPTPTPTPTPDPTPTSTPPPGQVATPMFNPDGGDASGCANSYTYHVTIQSATNGALISYTEDSSTPTPTHGTQIANGSLIELPVGLRTKTLQAMAYKSGMTNSPVYSADFSFSRDCGGLPTPGPEAPGTIRGVTYNLDKAGNRTSIVDGGVTKTYAPNAINQYTSAEGSTVTNGAEHEIRAYKNVSYTYINDEHLTRASNGTNIYDLKYDALGRCVKRTLNGNDTYYVYGGEKPILEYNAAGAQVGWNVYGKAIDEILQRSCTLGNYFFQQDHAGNVTHLTDTTTGALIERYRYDAFGLPTIYAPNGTVRAATAYDNRFLFTGREYAGTFKFYEYRARAYSPSLGRFMSEDRKLFDGSDHNLFRYCHNDPVDLTDPMGTDAQA